MPPEPKKSSSVLWRHIATPSSKLHFHCNIDDETWLSTILPMTNDFRVVYNSGTLNSKALHVQNAWAGLPVRITVASARKAPGGNGIGLSWLQAP